MPGKPNSSYGGPVFREYSDDPDNAGRGPGKYRFLMGEHVKKED